MREKYWEFFKNTKYRFFYYKHFQILYSRINFALTVFCSLTALSSVAAWGIWKSAPIIWSLLICISQLIQAILPQLPYSDMLCSTKFMICSLDKLLVSIENTWHEIDVYDYSDEKILKYLEKYNCQVSELTFQFFSGTYLPYVKRCEEKATEECTSYFKTNFPS